jgi:hypothetical protein
MTHGFFEKSERELVDHLVDSLGQRGGDNSAPLAEMQRRQVEAIRAFNLAAGRQATVMIWLTVAIAVLTVFIAALTAVMVWKGIE